MRPHYWRKGRRCSSASLNCSGRKLRASTRAMTTVSTQSPSRSPAGQVTRRTKQRNRILRRPRGRRLPMTCSRPRATPADRGDRAAWRIKPGERVADLGCGSGVFTDLLRRHGCDAIGLDLSPKLIALGRRKYSGRRVSRGRRRAPAVSDGKLRRRAAERPRPPPARSRRAAPPRCSACCGRAGGSSHSIPTA